VPELFVIPRKAAGTTPPSPR